jgi:hypothetical protein
VNNAAINMGVQVPLLYAALDSLTAEVMVAVVVVVMVEANIY